MSGFADGRPELEMSAAWYDEAYGAYTENDTHRTLYTLVAALTEGPVLDVGCGAGGLAAVVSDYAAGIDVSAVAVGMARAAHPGHRFDVCTLDTYTGPAYQTAVFVEVLEHVYDDLGMLELVPPGRRVVASVPSFWTKGHCRWFTAADEVLGRYGDLMSIDYIERMDGTCNWWHIFTGVRS